MITPFETMIKDIKKHYKLNNTSLAYELGVSGYAVSSWLGGQRPSKPNYAKVKELYKAINKERPTNPVEFDVFDDMQKVFYSKRLKAVFGMKLSSVLTTFNQWCKTNEKRGEHFYNGHYWCATTFDIAFEYWFKHSFTSKQDFSDAVNKLTDAKLLIESNVLTDKGNTWIWRVDVDRLTKLYQERVKDNVN